MSGVYPIHSPFELGFDVVIKSLFDEANGCFRRSQDLLDRITDAAAALESSSRKNIFYYH